MVHLQAAVDHDLVPDSTSAIQQIVTDEGDRHHTPIVDLYSLGLQHRDQPRSFFLDEVHVNQTGADAIARALAPVVAEALP